MLLLSFVRPEGIQTLIDGLRLYFDRKASRPEFEIELTDTDGKVKIRVRAKDMSPEHIAETTKKLHELGLFTA